jgi:hypothetical protein
VGALGKGTIADPPAPEFVPFLRAYNRYANYHFFTVSEPEFQFVVAHGYDDESTGRSLFKVSNVEQPGTVPIFRMYNPHTGRHYYTAAAGERDILKGLGWVFEITAGHLFPEAGPGRAEVFRLYNRDSGTHLYTHQVGEKDAILQMFPGIWEQHTSLGFAQP